MQEACKLIWTRRLQAPGSLSTPTLSNLPHCPLSSSGTPRLSATQLYLLYSFSLFHSVGENVCNCLNSSRVDIRSYGETPVLRTGLLGSAVARRVVTMVTRCQLRLTCWYQTSAGRVIYERQAGKLMVLAGLFMRQQSEKGLLSTRPRERKGDLGL